jgi:putative ABC transport system permease protein
MVGVAFLDKMISPDYPDYKRERSLYVTTMELKNEKENWLSRSDVSYYFLSHYVSKLKTVEKMAISSGRSASNTYVKNKKLVISYKYTNADYWNVLEYQFLEGKPYSQSQISNAEHIAVITERTKKAYFGDKPKVVGEYITADNINYRVIGVVANVAESSENLSGDMYIPYTLSKEDYNKFELMGSFNAVLLAKSKEDVPKMKAEFEQMMKKIPSPSKEFDKVYCNADYYAESMTRRIAGSGTDSGFAGIVMIMSGIVLLFLLLPTINLVNINITRIMERSSEIGVRKAFGASSKTLVYQFLVENIILTFFGGLIGIVLTAIAIYFINGANFIADLHLEINLKVLGYCLLTCLFFGLFSGVYPAWRMSRLNVVKALKA